MTDESDHIEILEEDVMGRCDLLSVLSDYSLSVGNTRRDVQESDGRLDRRETRAKMAMTSSSPYEKLLRKYETATIDPFIFA